MSQAEEFAAGKVTGITKFGAFVKLEDGRSGLVHISEVANTYVDDVSKHLKVGQDVKVKVLSVDDKGRINLSIKQALPREERPVKKPVDPTGRVVRPAVETSFEDKLKRFMQDSDSKISGLYADRRVSRKKSR